MGKKDEYRFNLRFDETDEMHRLVVKYLNSCGHNKAKYIVRAFLAYWKMSGKSLLSYVFPEIDAEQLLPEAKPENDKKTAVVAKASDAENDNGTYIQKDHSEQQLLEKSLQEDHFVNLEGDYDIYEVDLPSQWIGMSVGWIDIRKKYGINIIAVRHGGVLNFSVTPDTTFEETDTLLVLGQYRELQKCFKI